MNDAPIYLDHCATTPCDARVVEAMLPWFTEHCGNAASGHHSAGRLAADAVDDARKKVAGLVGAGASGGRDVVFTSGATEANNLALKGAAQFYGGEGGRGRHIITSGLEHKAVLEPLESLRTEGYDVTVLPGDETGTVTAAQVETAMRDDTILVSIMWANNETGVINDIAGIGALCKARGVFLHTDATQAVGKIAVDVNAAGVDLMSWSAHKMYGPKGVGALYARRRDPRVRLVPLFDGGGHERGLRSGTLNVPGIVGFGEASAIATELMMDDSARLGDLRDRMERELCERCDEAVVNASASNRLPHVSNISFVGCDASRLMAAMPGLAISSGAACSTTQGAGASVVLRRMGLGDVRAIGSLRISLGRGTTEAEIGQAIEVIVNAVATVDREVGECEL